MISLQIAQLHDGLLTGNSDVSSVLDDCALEFGVLSSTYQLLAVITYFWSQGQRARCAVRRTARLKQALTSVFSIYNSRADLRKYVVNNNRYSYS